MKLFFFISCIFIIIQLNCAAQQTDKKGATDFALIIAGCKNQINGINNFSDYGYGGSLSIVFYSKTKYNLVSGIELWQNKIFIDSVQVTQTVCHHDMLYTVQFLSLPIIIRLSTGKIFKPFVESGVNINWLYSVYEKGQEYSDNTINIIDNKSGSAKTVDVGITGGIGLILTKKVGFILNLNYHYGLPVMLKEHFTEVRNSYWKISLGIYLNRGATGNLF
ncbi:MAG: outer membrane beta-barrel protein [Bacteroidia bacterium]|nr:outer membrane beta-barrel protein [Bacteroidia bacterium]